MRRSVREHIIDGDGGEKITEIFCRFARISKKFAESTLAWFAVLCQAHPKSPVARLEPKLFATAVEIASSDGARDRRFRIVDVERCRHINELFVYFAGVNA